MDIRIANTTFRRQQSPFRLRPTEILSLARQNSASKMRVVQAGLVLVDGLVLGMAFLLAYQLRFYGVTAQFFAPDGWQDEAFYRTTVFLLIPVWLVLFRLFKLYDPAILFSGHQEYTNLFNACTVGIMLVILFIFMTPTLTIARAWVLMAWLLAFMLVAIVRFVVRRLVYLARYRGHFMTPTYIVGANPEGVAIAEHLISAPQLGINVIGFIDDTVPMGEEVVPGLAVHGTTDRAEALCHKFGIERMIVATSGVEREHLLRMFKRFVNVDDVAVWLSSGMYEMLTTGIRVQDIGSMAMISVNRVRLTGINVVGKALLDYIGALAGLIVLSPLFLAIILIMKRTDPGPIIHRRRVVGVGGSEFDAYKFRTMVVGADEKLREILATDPAAREEFERTGKLKNDPRITRIGQFLRKTSVDELPQLVNVLRGEMSLVGPRMITPAEVQRYGQWDMNIHTVKPGITGLWQVSGRSDITYDERVRLDMHYIRNYSIWLDLQIIFWTIPAVLMSRGAY
jgi:exopolysaccharide biosynthesis polyprenyl glycosylphosphotransferase